MDPQQSSPSDGPEAPGREDKLTPALASASLASSVEPAVAAGDDDALRALLPLSPLIYQILLALTDGERHGYRILQDIQASSANALGVYHRGPGALYRAIKQLLALKLIAPADVRPDPSLDDERRRYYRLTARGRRAAQLEAVRLLQLVQEARAKGLIDGTWGLDGGSPRAQLVINEEGV